MAGNSNRTGFKAAVRSTEASLAERLERGDIIYYPVCPFLLPEGEDRRFLLEQKVGGWLHKNISYEPNREKLRGFRYQQRAQAERLGNLLGDVSRVATGWLAGVLPTYAAAWRLDRLHFRPKEEATRRLRWTARNDLLHVDAFPTRPANGCRILRLFVNFNPNEPRVWITADTFAQLLQRFGQEVGLPEKSELDRMTRSRLPWSRRSAYDDFMLRLHHFLKANDDFQERCFKRYWNFVPGSAWLMMGDAVSHAVLRGRYALDHSYFIAPETLALPQESPLALLKGSGQFLVQKRAA